MYYDYCSKTDIDLLQLLYQVTIVLLFQNLAQTKLSYYP